MAGITVPLPLVVFMLYIEPLLALIGAFYAAFRPFAFLYMTHAPSTASVFIPSGPEPRATASSLWAKFTTYYRTGGSTSFAQPSVPSIPSISPVVSLERLSYIPGATSITTALAELGTAWLFVALSQAVVLRAVYPLESRRDLQVWKAFAFCLLISDFAHLWSLRLTADPLDLYVRFWTWNTTGFVTIGTVYIAILSRLWVFSELGFTETATVKETTTTTKKKTGSR